MPFVGSFSVAQSRGSVIVTDTSTGADPTITDRQIFFQRSDGSFLVPSGTLTDYVDFPLPSGTSITINNLATRDYAVNITVVWVAPTPDPAGTYTATMPFLLRYFTMTFLYGLTQEQQVARPRIISRNTYLRNKFLLFCYMQEAINAISEVGDIVNAQGCLNAAYNMMKNQNQYF